MDDNLWSQARRTILIQKIDDLSKLNTKNYQAFRAKERINYEHPSLDTFVGCAFRLQNLRTALQTYTSGKLESMKKGFEEL